MALTREQCHDLEPALHKVAAWYEKLLEKMHAAGEPLDSPLYLKTKEAWNRAHGVRIHCMYEAIGSGCGAANDREP